MCPVWFIYFTHVNTRGLVPCVFFATGCKEDRFVAETLCG